jgi:cell division septation protein DedD
MQKNNQPNKSTIIIQKAEEAKRKSRHRFIGSVALLIIALIILLNITSRIKPVPINPEVVEIKNSSSAPVIASAPITNHSIASQVKIDSSKVTSSTVEEKISASKNIAQHKVTVIHDQLANNQVHKQELNINEKPVHQQHIESSHQHKANKVTHLDQAKINNSAIDLNPEDILNGISDNSSTKTGIITKDKADKAPTNNSSNISYIQFAALSSEEKALKLQQDLSNHGVNAQIKPIQTEKGLLYRLRAGPFNHEQAIEKLKAINNAGYTGIITGK